MPPAVPSEPVVVGVRRQDTTEFFGDLRCQACLDGDTECMFKSNSVGCVVCTASKRECLITRLVWKTARFQDFSWDDLQDVHRNKTLCQATPAAAPGASHNGNNDGNNSNHAPSVAVVADPGATAPAQDSHPPQQNGGHHYHPAAASVAPVKGTPYAYQYPPQPVHHPPPPSDVAAAQHNNNHTSHPSWRPDPSSRPWIPTLPSISSNGQLQQGPPPLRQSPERYDTMPTNQPSLSAPPTFNERLSPQHGVSIMGPAPPRPVIHPATAPPNATTLPTVAEGRPMIIASRGSREFVHESGGEAKRGSRPRKGRSLRRLSDGERRERALKRRLGACEECRKKRVKCHHNDPIISELKAANPSQLKDRINKPAPKISSAPAIRAESAAAAFLDAAQRLPERPPAANAANAAPQDQNYEEADRVEKAEDVGDGGEGMDAERDGGEGEMEEEGERDVEGEREAKETADAVRD